jgi:F-type H+-transporting ATPase subunit b
MNGLIDIKQVATQILGFLILLWGLRKWAWGPVLEMLEARRRKIAGEFEEAERRKAEALELKARYEQDLRGIEAQARARIQQAVLEGQKVAAEIKSQAQAEAQQRLTRAQEEIAHERDRAKEALKEQIVSLAVRSAEKILRRNLDDPTQRKLASDFIDEVGAPR